MKTHELCRIHRKTHRHSADFLKRTFGIDFIRCRRCENRTSLSGGVRNPQTIQVTLTTRCLSPRPPQVAPAKRTPCTGKCTGLAEFQLHGFEILIQFHLLLRITLFPGNTVALLNSTTLLSSVMFTVRYSPAAKAPIVAVPREDMI